MMGRQRTAALSALEFDDLMQRPARKYPEREKPRTLEISGADEEGQFCFSVRRVDRAEEGEDHGEENRAIL